jgi:ubiquinone/menaquinone biosynthesis C-methylase UbiE
MIVTDAFLTRFDETERKHLLSEWYRVLKPGGRVVTTARISSGVGFGKVVASDSEVEDFVSRAQRSIAEREPWLRPMQKTISALARDYARNIVSYPLASEEQVRSLFENFECHINTINTRGELEGTTKYVQLVALRR